MVAQGHLGGSVGEASAFGSGHDPGSRDLAPHRAPCSAESLLLPLPLPQLVLCLSFSLCQIKKLNNIFKNNLVMGFHMARTETNLKALQDKDA